MILILSLDPLNFKFLYSKIRSTNTKLQKCFLIVNMFTWTKFTDFDIRFRKKTPTGNGEACHSLSFCKDYHLDFELPREKFHCFTIKGLSYFLTFQVSKKCIMLYSYFSVLALSTQDSRPLFTHTSANGS